MLGETFGLDRFAGARDDDAAERAREQAEVKDTRFGAPPLAAAFQASLSSACSRA